MQIALRNPVESLNYFDFNLQVLGWRLYAYLLRHQSELKKYSDVEEVNPSRQGSEDTHLHAVLPVSISQAEQVRLAYSLQEKLGRVHRRVAASRCGGVNGLMSGCGENFDTSTNIQFKALTNHRGRSL
jgi:hypothetical protein